MAYTWEPRWEPYVVEVSGIRFRTCRDKITGMIACPICIHAYSKCLGGNDEPGYETENSFFFRDEDVIKHIRDYHGGRRAKHIYKALRKRMKSK